MSKIKPIRITAAHYMKIIKQDNLVNNKFKVKYKKGVKKVDVKVLEVFQTGLTSFITLTYWIISYFFYDNIELTD